MSKFGEKYIGDKKEEFAYLQKKMCDALNKIATKISEEQQQKTEPCE